MYIYAFIYRLVYGSVTANMKHMLMTANNRGRG